MVSLIHEGLIELVRGRPDFVGYLLSQVLHVDVPRFTEARLTEATLNQLVPVEYHADAVVLFVDDKPVLGAIVEAQLQVDATKEYTWPLYAVAARARHRCQFELVVVTPNAATAAWAARPLPLGSGMICRPNVIGPDAIPKVTDADRAASDPQLAVLSAMAHGQGDPDIAVQIAEAAASAAMQLPEDQRKLYLALIESALSDAARKELLMIPQAKDYFSESQKRSFERGEAKGEARGEARGKADALLQILASRNLIVTDEQRRRITECSDLAKLNHWIDRALRAAPVEDILG